MFRIIAHDDSWVLERIGGGLTSKDSAVLQKSEGWTQAMVDQICRLLTMQK